MSTGFWIFAAVLALAAVCAGISCHRAAARLGRAAAARWGAVLALSLAVYAAVSVCLGYGVWPQAIAALAGYLPLWLGHRFVPSLDEMRGDRS